jgi:hypothetical protein
MRAGAEVTPARAIERDAAASRGEAEPGSRGDEPQGWNRVLAWLGLGSIAATRAADSHQHCAPGCVRKPKDPKRRKRAVWVRRLAALPPQRSAAGSLARKSKEILERVTVWVSP